jgi:hypothetical protein
MENDIINLYQQIVNGKRKKMPNGVWKDAENSKKYASKLLRYVFEDVLRYDHKKIIKEMSIDFLKKHCLYGMVLKVFNGSPFLALENAYPGQFKFWELNNAPMDMWNSETIGEAVRWMIEDKMQLKFDEAAKKLSISDFKNYGLYGILFSDHLNGKILNALKIAYPDKFLSK